MHRPRSAPRSREPLRLPIGYGLGADRQTVGLSSRHQGRCVVSVWILPYRPLFGFEASPVFNRTTLAWLKNLTPRFRRRQWPKRRRSVATVLVVKGALYIFLALDLLSLSGCPMLQH